ncbi:MAG TPA: hypothetical protein VKH42_20540, partial [Vicinamibacterales bacterium]|nr:hypothetical protein [Vicinamibacterales bacterium]
WFGAIAVSLACAVAPTPAQGPQLTAVMREKLDHAQKILEAVVTSDWVGLEEHSRELEQLTRDPRWMVLRYPEYARHSAAFVRTIQALHRAAAQRDLEETPRAYVAVTLSCVECHRYLARERVALARPINRDDRTVR